MRLDLSGLGDTPPRPGTKERAVYGPFGALDIAEAATCLREAWGARTVEVHRARVMHKLDLHYQTDLVRYALRRGILPLEA